MFSKRSNERYMNKNLWAKAIAQTFLFIWHEVNAPKRRKMLSKSNFSGFIHTTQCPVFTKTFWASHDEVMTWNQRFWIFQENLIPFSLFESLQVLLLFLTFSFSYSEQRFPCYSTLSVQGYILRSLNVGTYLYWCYPMPWDSILKFSQDNS